MTKKTLIFTLLTILLIGCKSGQKSCNTELVEEPIVKSFKIDTIFQGMNETEMNALLILYIDSLDVHLDSMILTDCNIHDRRIPFHQIVGNHLLFEDCKQYPNSIKIMDLEKLKVISEIDGFIEINRNNTKPKSVDLCNEIMIYFSIEKNSNDIYFVNSLNLKDFTTIRLDTIITSGDPMDGYPIISQIDSASRKVIITYINKDYKNNGEVVNY